MKRFVFLNALPIKALCGEKELCRITLTKTEPKEIVSAIRSWGDSAEVISFIRHPSTVEALRKLGLDVSTSSGFYSYSENDAVIVVIPKKLVRRGAEQKVELEDLEFYYVFVE